MLVRVEWISDTPSIEIESPSSRDSRRFSPLPPEGPPAEPPPAGPPPTEGREGLGSGEEEAPGSSGPECT